MALALKMTTPVQSNDATTIQIVDDTGVYAAGTNTGGWGTPNQEVSYINGSTAHLYLGITITTSSGAVVTYDDIELYNLIGPATSVEDLVFNITPDMLISDGIPLGDVDSTFPDGWYSIKYSFLDDLATYPPTSNTHNILMDGTVKIQIYDKLRDIPYSNLWVLFNHDFKEWYDILYPQYYNGILVGMELNTNAANKNVNLNILGTLERLLNN